jgi:hypothetical protein
MFDLVRALARPRLPAAQAAARELAVLLRAMPMRRYPELEVLRHAGRSYPIDGQWWNLRPDDVRQLVGLDDAWAALGVTTFHQSGYVREAAVRALGAAAGDEGLELPFLLLRLNDWVPEVRRAARAALASRVHVRYADAMWRALPLVERLREQRRADHGGVIRWIELLLVDPDTRPALVRALGAPDRWVRRHAARLALARADVDPADVERALGDEDDVVRSIAFGERARLDEGARRAAVLRAVDDPSAMLRRRALEALAAEDGIDVATRRHALEARLADRQRWLRELARALLQALVPAFDAAARYRELSATTRAARPLIGALAGLADSGGEDDVLAVAPFLADPRAKVRGAAVAAAATLDAESVTFLVDALVDPSRRVARAAARLLSRRARAGLADLVTATFEAEDTPPHARSYALEVLCAAQPWPRLERLLRLTRSRNPEAAALARARVSAHTSIAPTAGELAAVERALADCALDAAERAAVRREMDVWRRPT